MDKQDAEDMANVERYEASRIGADATEAILNLQSDLGATVFRQEVEIARLKAALDVERAACDRFYAAGTKTWRAGVDLTKTIHAESFWTAWDAHHAVRASDRNDEG